jgi:hypothetical protein
MLCITSQIHVL